jgi:hypothetical protein
VVDGYGDRGRWGLTDFGGEDAKQGLGLVRSLGREAGFSATAADAPPPVEMTDFS